MSNWIDTTLSFLSPTLGARRARARHLEKIYKDAGARSYEGATTSRRTDGWRSPSTSANAENQNAIRSLRDRSRDLVRNNPYATRAISGIETNTVGTGIIAKISQINGKAKNDLVSAWKQWAETLECDADGLLDFYGLQSLAMRTIAESGEVLIRRRRRLASDGLTVPIQLQILEPDFIDSIKTMSLDNGGKIIQGVEFDALGRRVAYWLYPSHPGDTGITGLNLSFRSNRIPAEDILHLFRIDRAGQVRGISWAAPIILRLRDFDDYEDAQLVRQKIAACFAAFVGDIEAPTDAIQNANTLGDKIEPGAIENLPPGKSISFPNPPQVTGYGEFASITLHAVATGYGVPYELLTQDFSQVNFSSARMAWLEFNRNINKWRWQLVVPRMCNPVL